MTALTATLDLTSPDATARFAGWLGQRLAAGDILLLNGPIGAGKTHFARSLIQSLQSATGQTEDIPSPTFTLVQIYQAGPLEIWHSDLYRLTHPNEALELGLEDAFDTALVLIEWPDRLGSLTPASALSLTLAPTGNDSRHLTASATAPRWHPLLAAISAHD